MAVDHTRTITVTPAGSNYTVVSDAAIDAGGVQWVSATKTTDNNGVADVWTITIQQNKSNARVATITATHSNNNTDTINVNQAGVVADTQAPVITLLGSSTVTTNLGVNWTDAGATATDNVDGDITSSIVVDDSVVDINTVGSYIVTYNVSDAAGNAAVEVVRTIAVVAQSFAVEWELIPFNLTGAYVSLTDGGSAWTGNPQQLTSAASGENHTQTFYVVPDSGNVFNTTSDVQFTLESDGGAMAQVTKTKTAGGSIKIDLQLNNVTVNDTWSNDITGAAYTIPTTGPMAFRSLSPAGTSVGTYTGGQSTNGVRNYQWINNTAAENNNQALLINLGDAGGIDLTWDSTETNAHNLAGYVYLSTSADGSTVDNSTILNTNEWIHGVSLSNSDGTNSDGTYHASFIFDDGDDGSISQNSQQQTTQTGN